MMAAAAAWDLIAGQLEALERGYSSALAELHGQHWSGSAAAAMAGAATPYAAWAATTAAQASRTASQARAAAAAYEAAFAATVPPAAVTANRIQLAMLVATNFFGQNTPLIAATEVAYAEMWAQDAAAMFGYSASSTAATDMAPFSEPPRTTNATDGFAALLKAFDDLTTFSRTGDFFSFNGRTAAMMGDFVNECNLYGFQAGNVAAAPPTPGGTTGMTLKPGSTAVLVHLGRAESIGGLSVPRSWPTTVVPGSTAPAEAPPEPSGPPRTAFRALPPWAADPATPAGGTPPAGFGPTGRAAGRYAGNPARRMRVRRFQMPRLAVGG